MPDIIESCNAFARNLCSAFNQESASAGLNMVVSPVSIQGCMMLAFMGAAGTTAEELRVGLKLDKGDKNSIANSYREFWTKECNFDDRGPSLKIVNRLYVNKKLHLNDEFKQNAREYFNFKPVALEFSNAAAAIKEINEWVEQETDNKILQLLEPDAVDADTSAILVNALYFKGKWAKPFTPESTLRDDFYVDKKNHFEVDMMYQEDKFKFAKLDQLKARAIQLPFEKSDISMVIILPNSISGLAEVEKKLQTITLCEIEAIMTLEDVEVALPRFQIEFDIDLKRPLETLGISEVFGEAADLSQLFTNNIGQRISAARHRGYIDVNEAGSEAAAVTYMKIVPMMLNMNRQIFKADHPFVFYICNSKAVFFAGRYSSPPLLEKDIYNVRLSGVPSSNEAETSKQSK